MPEARYSGKNVVATNRSSRNNGKPATLRVVERRATVRFIHGIDGGNEYGIELDKARPVADLAAQLIAYCPRSSLPGLLGAIGEILARQD